MISVNLTSDQFFYIRRAVERDMEDAITMLLSYEDTDASQECAFAKSVLGLLDKAEREQMVPF